MKNIHSAAGVEVMHVVVCKYTGCRAKGGALVSQAARVASGGEVGRAAIWREPLDECYYQKALHRLRPKRGYNVTLMLNVLQRQSANGFLSNFVTQTSIAHLPKDKFQTVPIPLPPTRAEQEAIAEGLSDADALIDSLEQLLVKKRQLKLGAMQELLTGTKRLPGFGGEWEVTRLRDLLTYERPDQYIVQSTKYTVRGEVPVLTANKAFVLGYTDESFGICRDLPAIVFDDFTTDCKYAALPFKVKSSAIKLLRPKHDRVSLRYVYERMQLIRHAHGDHKRYYISEYQNREFPIPDYNEQTGIVSLLSDMDANIAALEAKLTKAHSIKQGMMQELLTGRIRLI